MHLSRYIIPARAPLWGKEEGGYATSDLPLFILTFWSLHGAHAGHTVLLSYVYVFSRGRFKPDSNQ